MSDENRDVLEVLPVCGAQNPDAAWKGLAIGGLVAHPRELDAEGLSRLAQGEIVDDFRCVSGWVAPDQRWEGVPLSDLLDDAGTLPGAQYVGFTSGGYTVGMSVGEAREAGIMVALRHNGAPLTVEHGASPALGPGGQGPGTFRRHLRPWNRGDEAVSCHLNNIHEGSQCGPSISTPTFLPKGTSRPSVRVVPGTV